MKRQVKRGLFITMAVILLLATPVMAASKKKKAMKAYSKYLSTHIAPYINDRNWYDASYRPSKTNYASWFFICDINKDKVPELFTSTSINHRWFIVRIFTYKKGKVKPYKTANRSAAVFNNYSGASGHYYFYVCAKKHIHNGWRGSTPFGFETNETVYKNSHGKIVTGKTLPVGCREKYYFKYENTKTNRKLLKKGKIAFK